MSTCQNGGRVDDEPIFVTVKREFADECSALAALVGEGLLTMRHVSDWCSCDGTRTLTAACVLLTLGRRDSGNIMASKPAEML